MSILKKILFKIYFNKQTDVNIAFKICCTKGHFCLAKYIYNTNNINIHDYYDENFNNSCNNGHYNIIQWLYEIKLREIIHIDLIFILCCSKKNIKIAKYLFDMNNFNNDIIQQAFYVSCLDGQLHISKWLYSLNRINIHIHNDLIFSNSCHSGNLKTLKWLYSLGNINIHTYDDYVFRISCEWGYLNISKWIYSLDKIDIHINHDYAFRWACINKHIRVIKWLCSLYKGYKYTIGNTIGKPIDYTIIKFERDLKLCIKNPDIYSIKNIILTNNDTCIICLSQEQYMVVLECKHIYCTLCLQQYFFVNTHITCCYCRKIINDDIDRHKIYKLYE